jgi:hypothetical protein
MLDPLMWRVESPDALKINLAAPAGQLNQTDYLLKISERGAVGVLDVTHLKVRPDNRDRKPTIPCGGHHIGRTAVTSGGLAVPHRDHLVGTVQHPKARVHVRR